MHTTALVVFWTATALVLYVYLGYPLLLVSGILGRKQPWSRAQICPSVSILIPAHNEEAAIGAKLANLAALCYPSERIEVLVGNDGSNDRTEEIVKRHADVTLYSTPMQMGKSAIQNELVRRSCGEILVFTDADCLMGSDALAQVVSNFADHNVGLVTARPRYRNASENGVTRNEGLYLRYESWIRVQESDRGLLAAGSGSLFALRRSLWQPLRQNIGDDFVLPLQVALAGFRNVLEQNAQVWTHLGQNRLHSMLALKRRIISKDFLGLMLNHKVLNPVHTGVVALGLWSHKLLRWLVPYFLLAGLLANMFLLRTPAFRIALAAQCAFYLLALVGVIAKSQRSLCSVPLSFCIVNLASFLATLQCALGKTSGKWQPAR
jgi:cellulose synthase/poly-beta-1,6-N-acetylglucosamine synthase-like glycosyltransferase